MKNKRKVPTSKWKNLAWEKVNVNSSSDNDNDVELDDSKYLNAKNHYDDPDADPSELYESMVIKGNENTRTNKSKYDYEPDNVEGADDPGIFVGLEVIDGSQYQVEKVQVGSGYITRLVFEGDNEKQGKKEKVDSDSESHVRVEKSKSNKIKTSDSNVTAEVDKNSKSEDREDKSNSEDDPSKKKKLTRKERNRLKLEKMKAKRLEKKAERKRKRSEGQPGLEPKNQKNQNNENKVRKKSSNSEITENRKRKEPPIKSVSGSSTSIEKEKQKQPTVSQEDISTIQNSWSLNTGGVYLHEKICASLHQMQFVSPTPIQASTLAASILGQRDVVGAAPTGSVSWNISYYTWVISSFSSDIKRTSSISCCLRSSSIFPDRVKLLATCFLFCNIFYLLKAKKMVMTMNKK